MQSDRAEPAVKCVCRTNTIYLALADGKHIILFMSIRRIRLYSKLYARIYE